MLGNLKHLFSSITENMQTLVHNTLGQERSLEQLDILMSNALKTIEVVSANIDNMFPLKQEVACMEGCGLCCSNITVVTQAHFAIHAFQYAKKNANPIAYTHALQQRAKQSTDCYFLQNGRCSNYEVRPSACRTFFSYDTNQCREGKFSRTGKLSNNAIAFVDEGLRNGLRDLSINHQDLSFNKTMALLMQDENVIQKWLDGENAFENCHIGPLLTS